MNQNEFNDRIINVMIVQAQILAKLQDEVIDLKAATQRLAELRKAELDKRIKEPPWTSSP
jgi:hypothetical protein